MSKLLKFSKIARNLDLLKRRSHTSTLKNAVNGVSLKAGDQLHNYTVSSVVPVKEFDLTAVKLVHRTGAEHLHISRNDSDNVFAVAFRTTPLDSTGVPHILEHVTLCGSERFPVRDPFFKMNTRSLATFMNAFTANDWTMYPFSSQNEKDFKNLLNVYLDAVFNPRLRYMDFNQEGWRLEHEQVDDPNSPIVLKGVVYNEMKGVFSDPHQVYSQEAQNHLLPSGTYGVVSGGDPKCIPDLTWKQLKQFHEHHYHPSNSRFYTYGDMPLEQHLEFIDKVALSKFEKKSISTSVPAEPRWKSSKEVRVSCPVDHLSPDPESESIVSVNHLLCDVTDQQESFDLAILCSLLTDGEKAPFYRSLIESGLGSDYSPGTGFSNQTRDQSFSVGLQRVHKSNVNKVVQLIDETIDKVIMDGFEESRIKAALHKIELSLKHQSEKFGLRMILSLISGWNHGVEPIHLLQVNKHVDELKSRLSKEPDYFQKLATKYFKNGQHKLVLISDPDQEYLEKNRKLESDRLQKMVSDLTDIRKKEILEEGRELARIQSSAEEDVSCLPTLHVSDIPNDHKDPETRRTTFVAAKESGSPSLMTPSQNSVQPTNGVVYLRLASDVSCLPERLRPYLPLFCHVVTKMGTQSVDYLEQSERTELYTGGLEAANLLVDHASEVGKYQNFVSFSSFCLEKNTQEMLSLWRSIFRCLTLDDHHRFYTLLTSFAAESAASLTSAGHKYAMVRAASSIGDYFALKETCEGVSQLNFLKDLVSSVSPSSEGDSSLPFNREKVDELLHVMRDIASHLFVDDANLRASLITGESAIGDAVNQFKKFHADIRGCNSRIRYKTGPGPLLPKDLVYAVEKKSSPEFVKTHLEYPFQVNYLGKAFPAVPFDHPDHAPLQILSKILSSKYLHREIREKGGAYGGGSSAGSNAFYFYSYRDPNFSNTLKSFSDSVEWASDGKFEDQDIDEAKLSVFSQVDQPVSPGNQGMRMFLRGITEEQFANHRQRLLAASRSEILDVVSKYLSDESKSSVAAIGPKNEASSAPGWTVLSDK